MKIPNAQLDSVVIAVPVNKFGPTIFQRLHLMRAVESRIMKTSIRQNGPGKTLDSLSEPRWVCADLRIRSQIESAGREYGPVAPRRMPACAATEAAAENYFW